MSLTSFLSKQLIDVIDWTEPGPGILSYRYPMQDREIQTGAKLTVRETQMALFVNNGTVADVFAPGMYTLSTSTLPILTYLLNWDKGFASPFKSDVYFFSTRLQLNQKWGTPTPVTIRDKEFGPIRVRGYGIFAYHVQDPKLVHQKLSGTAEVFTADDVAEQLRSIIVTSMSTAFGTAGVPFVDMAANQVQLSGALLSALQPSFAEYGLMLETFQVQSISLPDELQKRLDERASIALVGDMKSYTQFQAAQSIPIAAANEGGLAGAGAGLGAGAALGQAMSQALGSSTGAAASAPGAASGSSPFDAIERLHDLMKKGILSEEEFQAKKAELLKHIG